MYRQPWKRALTLCAIILLTISLTGCMHMNAHLTINSDRSADWVIEMMTADNLSGFALEGLDTWAAARESMTEQGFTTSDVTEEGYSGFVAAKHYDNVEDLSNTEFFSTGSNLLPNADSAIKVDVTEGFFETRYDFNSSFDVSEALRDTGLTSGITNLITSDMKFDFVLTLPIKATTNNASEVSEDGLTYTWNMALDAPNEMQLSTSVPNITNIIITAAVALVLGLAVVAALVIIIMLIVKGQKKANMA